MDIKLFKSNLLSYIWNLHIQDPMTKLTYDCDNID